MGENSTSISQERKSELEKLGRASLRWISDAFLAMRDKKEPPPPIDTSILDGASRDEWKFYQRFQQITSYISTMRAGALQRIEGIQCAIESISRYVGEAIIAESFNRTISRTPIIMTSKEFLETRQKGVESYLSKDGEDISASAYELFFITLRHHLSLLSGNPLKPNPLHAIHDRYRDENTGSRYILESWNDINEVGFYVLKSGTRGEPMTKAQFDAFLAHEEELDIDDIAKSNFEGGIINIEKGLIADRASIHGITWHRIEGKAKSIKKWDAVLILDKLYQNPADVGDLIDEFPELIDAIAGEIAKSIRINIRDIPKSQWQEPVITRRKLYEMDFYSIRRRADTFYREKVGGDIAVIQDKWDAPEGYYSRPDPTIYRDSSLEAFIKECGASRLGSFEDAKDYMFRGYCFLRGFNTVIELIIRIHDLAGFDAYKVDISPIGESMAIVRSDIEFLYQTIRELPIEDKLRLPKLRAIKDHFLLRRLDRIEIPQVNIARASKLIKTLEAFDAAHFTEMYGLLFDPFRKNPYQVKRIS